MFIHTKNTYEDIIANIDEDTIMERMDLVFRAIECIQEAFGIFLFIQISSNAIFFTIWAYLCIVDNTYVVCALMAFTR